MIAYLDTILIKNPAETLQNPSITLRKQTETGEIGFSFTGDLVFTGTEYDYLYSKLVTDANALDNKVVLKFVNDCCGTPQIYQFYISHKGLKWCEGKCELNAVAVEKTQADDLLTCLKNTLIWDDYAGFKSKKHPRMSYCNELRPNWMHDAFLILSIATYTSLLIWLPIIASLVIAFNALNSLISWSNSNLNTNFNTVSIGGQTNIDLNDLQNYNNLLLSAIIGCGRKHPSPLVRDYAINVCGKCGLNFKSSILNNSSSAYFNTVYVNAPIHKGTLETDTTTYWIEDNKPLLNGTKFFDELKGIFNADWKIQGTDLVFERRDYFIPTTPWIDLTTYKKVNQVCWNWSEKTRYSYASFYYQKDGVNWVGGEVRSRWGDIVEWNNPYSTLQKGAFEPLIPYAACRFRDDGIDRDVLTFYEFLPIIGPKLKNYKNVMIMNSHHSYTPMLLIWDGKSVDNGKVDPTQYYFSGFTDADGNTVGLNQFYNYPFWFNENFPGNLYDNFWSIDDPRKSGYQGKDFTAEIIFDCDVLDAIDLDGQILTSEGIGKAKEISINFATNTLTISGTV